MKIKNKSTIINGARFINTGAVFQKKFLVPKPLNQRFFRIIFFTAFLAALLLVSLISAFNLPFEEINLKTDAVLSSNIGNNNNTVSYAVKLFEKWGIGKKAQDNGILLLVSMQDRALKIEVGYGLEGIITDLDAKRIIDDVIIPRFKINDYNTGIYNGIAEIANLIYAEQKNNTGFIEIVPSEAGKSFSGVSTLPFLLAIGIPLFISILILLPWLIIGGIVFAIFMRYYVIEHKCPQCNKIGLIIKRKWIEYPTNEQSGKQEVSKWCKYCSYSDKRVVAIAKLNRNYGSSSISGLDGSFSSSSSSSHSSSSFSSHHFSSHSLSSSSHHFGGGSSGGGGASGHW
jgi:uncharacterized protein